MISMSKIFDSNNANGVIDDRSPHRILDAFGDVEKCKIDEVYKADELTITATGTSPVAASLLPGAIALITTGSDEYDGDNIQVVGSRFKLDAGKPAYFGAKLTISDATQSDLLVGLCGVDTTLTAASSAHAVAVSAGGVFFSKLDAVTAGFFKTYSTGTEKNSAAAFTMDTSAHTYEFYFDGYKLYGYFDGALIATFTDTITTEVLTPSISFRTGATAAITCTVHWMRAFQLRT